MTLSDNLKKRIEIEEKWDIFKKHQDNLENKGIIPKTPFLLLRRYENYLEGAAEILVGCIIGVFSLMINFIIFVFLLHIEF